MNKQIDEMARDLCEFYNSDGTCCQDDKPCDFKCECYTDAQYLYEKGYRKQSEGEWIKEYREWDFDPFFYIDFTCSLCGTREQNKRPFCPNCGAHMRGGKNE